MNSASGVMLILLWTGVAVLCGVGVATLLLPRTKSWHTLGQALVAALAIASMVAAAVVTYSSATITQEEIDQAADHSAGLLHGTAGTVTQQRLMAVISAELGTGVFADSIEDSNGTTTYRVTPAGEDEPFACVVVTANPGTDQWVSTSTVREDDSACS